MMNVADKLGNEEEDKVSIVSDLETMVTFYCKSPRWGLRGAIGSASVS